MSNFMEKYKDYDHTRYNIQWEETHDKIMLAFENLYNEIGKRPTYQQIAERIGMSKITVSRHLKDMQYETDVTPKHKLKLDGALDKLYEIGMKGEGNAKALVEFIKLVANPTQKQEIEQTIKQKVLKVNFKPKDEVKNALSENDIEELDNDAK